MIFLIAIILQFQHQPETYIFDRIELNHVYNSEGIIVLDQIIYWEYDNSWKIVGWINLNGCRRNLSEKEILDIRKKEQWQPINKPWVGHYLIPYRNGKWYTATWVKNYKLITVKTKRFIITHTQYDREIRNRTVLPETSRHRLWWHK